MPWHLKPIDMMDAWHLKPIDMMDAWHLKPIDKAVPVRHSSHMMPGPRRSQEPEDRKPH